MQKDFLVNSFLHYFKKKKIHVDASKCKKRTLYTTLDGKQ